jgi:hypothetical protein
VGAFGCQRASLKPIAFTERRDCVKSTKVDTRLSVFRVEKVEFVHLFIECGNDVIPVPFPISNSFRRDLPGVPSASLQAASRLC